MGKVIYSTDDNALEALKERLAKQEADHEEMKKQNEYFRKKGTMVGYPNMTEEKAQKINARIESGYSWEKQPHPAWQLQNSNQEIRRTKQRIKQLEAEQNREEATTKRTAWASMLWKIRTLKDCRLFSRAAEWTMRLIGN